MGWRDTTVSPARLNAAGQQSGVNAIGGSGTSAYMPADFGAATSDRRELTQVFDQSLGSDWHIQYDFAAADPGGEGDRSLTGSLLKNGTAVSITYRVVDLDGDGDGDFQLYDGFGGGWTTIDALRDSVIFDPDVTTTPLVHTIIFSADWSAATAAGRALEISILDSNGGVKSASGLTLYHSAPAQNNELTGLTFTTFLSTGDYLLDNMVVPEPGTLALLGLGGAALGLGRRRRQRTR